MSLLSTILVVAIAVVAWRLIVWFANGWREMRDLSSEGEGKGKYDAD